MGLFDMNGPYFNIMGNNLENLQKEICSKYGMDF